MKSLKRSALFATAMMQANTSLQECYYPVEYPKEKASKEYQEKLISKAEEKRERRNRKRLLSYAKQETRSHTFKNPVDMAKLKQAVAFTGYFARLKAPRVERAYTLRAF